MRYVVIPHLMRERGESSLNYIRFRRRTGVREKQCSTEKLDWEGRAERA